MKWKIILIVLLLAAAGAGGWFAALKFGAQMPIASSNDRHVLYYTCSMHPQVHADKPGDCPICGMKLVAVYAKTDASVAADSASTPTDTNSAGRKVLYYQSSMHPWIKSDKPGKCPICGMNLVPIYEGDIGANTNIPQGMVKLNAASVSVINVQTEVATHLPIKRTI